MPDLQQKLKKYDALLRKWQASINLVSGATLSEAKRRHFDDSMQILPLLPENGTVLFDLGCGAGFPGLVLAMANPRLDVHLIESDTKKCTFLSTVSRETMTPVKVVNQRIEDVSRETIPDIVTARALASLDKLFDYCLPWAEENPDLVMVFLKGERADEELEGARLKYEFRAESFQSKTGAGLVLRLSGLKRKS